MPCDEKEFSMTTGGKCDAMSEHGRIQLSTKLKRLLLCDRF